MLNNSFLILFNSFFIFIMVFMHCMLNILKIRNDNNVGLENILKSLFIIFNDVTTCSRAIRPSSIDTDNIQLLLPKKG